MEREKEGAGALSAKTAEVIFFAAAFAVFSIFAAADDLVKAWGLNGSGQLGNGSTSNSSVPVDPLLPADVLQVSAGYDHSLALMSGGTVMAWGANDYGQFGNGANEGSLVPVAVSAMTDISAVSAGYWFSAVIKTDHTVWAFGWGTEGELGNGGNSHSNVPVQVAEPLDPTGFLTGVTKIASGYSHNLALKSDGTVWAWGDNTYGQLGNGNNTASNVAVHVTGISGITAIACGGWHSLALGSDGTVYAWGWGGYGELGNGSDNNSNIPVSVSNLTGVDFIAAGGDHSLAAVDGTAYSWGYNEYGELGDGTANSSNVPVQVSVISGVTALAGGEYHSAALLADGTVWSWGRGDSGQIGNSRFTNKRYPVKTVWLGNAMAVSAQGSHTLALYSCVTPSQPVISGITSEDSCGGLSLTFMAGSPASRHDLYSDSALAMSGVASPVSFRASDTSSHDYVIRSVNGSESCYVVSTPYTYSTTNKSPSAPAITSITDMDPSAQSGVLVAFTPGSPSTSHDLYMDGSLAAADFTSGGTFSPGDKELHLFTVRAWNGACDTFSPPFIGRDGSRALPTGGTQVWNWGDNYYGQLGNGNNNDSNVPLQVTAVSSICEVSGGQFHSLALESDGTVRSWGWGTSGQLGNGAWASSNVPVDVSNLTDVTAISAGGSHSLALRSDGTVWGWGDNTYGQLGIGVFSTKSNIPVQVLNLTGVVAIDAGDSCSMALKSDGTVWAWGYNYYGNLGDGTKVNKNLPTQVVDLSGAVAISAGKGHSLALLQDLTARAWGYNSQGALGDETWTQSLVPVQVSGFSGGVSVSAGGWHSLGLKGDGAVEAWGDDYYGELGDCGNTDMNYPVSVLSLTNVSAISAGDLHSLALKDDGTLWSWGYNFDGQLGLGNNTDTNMRSQVPGLANVLGISAGRSHSMALTGVCQTPSAPVITGVTDIDPFSLSGLAITYTPGSPATQHDLWVDGILAVTGFSSGGTYVPGDSLQHSFVIRAVNGTCYADSAPLVGYETPCCCRPPEVEVVETVNADKSGFKWADITYADNYRVVRAVKDNLSSFNYACHTYGITTGTTGATISGDDPSGETGRCYFYIIQGYGCSDPDEFLGPAGEATSGPRSLAATQCDGD